jgi:glycosyltransferase involved in cell wall biosynthesis
MKKRIAVIGLKGLPAFVGAGTVGENIINQLKDEYDFYVYSTSSHTSLKSGTYNGVYQKVFRKIPFKRINAFWYYLISALHARYVEKFDLIHLHNSFAAFTLLILKRKYRVVLTTHGAFLVFDKWKRYSWFWNFNTNKLVKKADYLCCVSKDERRQFKNLLNLDAHYIPNGINPISKENLPTVPVHEPYIFFGAGRIIRDKGLHHVIAALHKIGFKGKILVAGDLDQLPSYKSEILKSLDGLNIELLGLIKEKEVLLSYIMHARLFVYPSIKEAMSMMLLEAVSVDCPVICSDIIQNKDILNEEEALFFRASDTDDLAEKINWALSNPDSMKTRAAKAKRKFLEEFNWSSIAAQYKEVYQKFMK